MVLHCYLRRSLTCAFSSRAFSQSPSAMLWSLLLQHLIAFFRTPQIAIRLHSVCSEHIWRRTCKRQGHRRQSTRSGHGSYECFASNHENTVCSHTGIEHHRSATTTNPCIQTRTDASCPHCGTEHSWAGLRFPRGSHEYRESSVGKGSRSGASK